jgi:hypothetical protein
MRRSTDRLWPTTQGPREREAQRIIEAHPGITIGELRDRLGVGKARAWQLVDRLQRGRVRLDPPPALKRSV